MKKIFLAIMLLATFIFAGCNTQAAVDKEVRAGNDDLKIYMLNVRHGDAFLVRTKEQTILIDTGLLTEQNLLVKELERLSVTKIDKLILTHPHSDHIGNSGSLIKPSEKFLAQNPYLAKISVGEVFDNGVTYTNSYYRRYMKLVKALKIPRRSLKVGDVLDFGGGVEFKVLFPTSEIVAEKNRLQALKQEETDENSENDGKGDREFWMNNTSLVAKLTYKDFSMMFTGDCEKESEAKILAANNAKDLKCDILKAGHHGVRNASSKDFVAAVNPTFVLISTNNKFDEGNYRGTPHRAALENYLAQGVKAENILCTKWNGTVTVTTDGKNFSVTPEKTADWVENWLAKKRELGVK